MMVWVVPLSSGAGASESAICHGSIIEQGVNLAVYGMKFEG